MVQNNGWYVLSVWRGPHTKLREEAIWCGVSTGLKKELNHGSVYLVFKERGGGSGKELSLYY